jgi:hypothetical protein
MLAYIDRLHQPRGKEERSLLGMEFALSPSRDNLAEP